MRGTCIVHIVCNRLFGHYMLMYFLLVAELALTCCTHDHTLWLWSPARTVHVCDQNRVTLNEGEHSLHLACGGHFMSDILLVGSLVPVQLKGSIAGGILLRWWYC